MKFQVTNSFQEFDHLSSYYRKVLQLQFGTVHVALKEIHRLKWL